MREKSYGKRIPVPASEWEFAASVKDQQSGKEVIKACSTELYLRGGFKPGHIYEFIYPAKNPLVLGLGFAVVRDLVSFLRFESKDRAGKANPLASANKTSRITHAYAWGRSQSGRYLRDFVYHGFNEDEQHRKVFDAIAPHVAGGGRLFMNYEFARPVTSSQQHTNQLDPELFPHAYNIIKDAQTGRRDGILKRPRTDPLIFHTQTSTEYWQKRGCLGHTDGRGNDLKLPDNVRLYVIASAQHNSPFGSEPAKDDSQFLVNPLPAGDILRALHGRHGFVGDKRHPTAAKPLSQREGSHISAADSQRFSEDSRGKLRWSAQSPTVSRLWQKHSARQDGTFTRRNHSAKLMKSSCPRSTPTATTSPASAYRPSKSPSALTPVGTCVHAAWRRAISLACSARSFPSQKQSAKAQNRRPAPIA